MAVIQSGAGPTLWTIDTGSNAGRVTLYDINGNPLMGVDTISLINTTLDSLNETAVLNLTGQANCSFQAFGSSGTWTVSFEATIDGTNWFSIGVATLGTGAIVSTTTGDGVWFSNTSGYQGIRAKMTAFTSGQTQMSMIATPEEHTIGTAAGTNVNIVGTGGLALDSTLAKLTISPGTSLGANTLALMGGSVTTAAPTYTTGTINSLSLTTTGALRIDGSAVTQPVSGTVTANQGTSPWVTNVTQFGSSAVVTGTGASGAGIPRVTVSNDSNVIVSQATAANLNATVVQSTAANLRAQTASESATGSATPATAGLIGGAVTTAAPTYTTGNLGALSLTTGGLLRIDGSGVTQPVSGTVAVTQSTSPWVSNITQFGSNNVVTGTGASGVGIPRVTVSNDSNILATQSGTWTVQPGNTANTTPWLFTINQGGNSATVTAGNALKVDGSAVTQPVSGTVTANQGTSPWVTNITQFGSSAVVTGTGASGAGIPRVTVSNDSNVIVSQATAANLNATVVGTGSDNTANSTAKLPVLPARANTSAPSFTDGNMVPLSTDTSGNLRVTGSLIIDKSSTSAITSVASATSSTSILASNASRILATIYNGANKTMYLALASTASTTSYTIQMDANSYFELPADYTGAISAVWANGVSGNALVTELT